MQKAWKHRTILTKCEQIKLSVQYSIGDSKITTLQRRLSICNYQISNKHSYNLNSCLSIETNIDYNET